MAQRRATRVGVIFLDLDYFKQINDSLGHAVGDQVLQLATRRLEAAVRESDSVSRHGGDEFVVLLAEMVERERRRGGRAEDPRVAGRAGAHRPAHALALGAASASASIPRTAPIAMTLIDCADAAMYRAKKAGPGRYAFCSEIVDTDAGDDVGAPTAEAAGDAPRRRRRSPSTRRACASCSRRTGSSSAPRRARRSCRPTPRTAHHRQINFVAMAAHALRNPLSAIRMAAATLKHPQGRRRRARRCSTT